MYYEGPLFQSLEKGSHVLRGLSCTARDPSRGLSCTTRDLFSNAWKELNEFEERTDSTMSVDLALVALWEVRCRRC